MRYAQNYGAILEQGKPMILLLCVLYKRIRYKIIVRIISGIYVRYLVPQKRHARVFAELKIIRYLCKRVKYLRGTRETVHEHLPPVVRELLGIEHYSDRKA